MSHFLDISHCALNSLPLCSFMAFLWGHFSATIRSVSDSCSRRRRGGKVTEIPPDIIDPERTLLHFAGAPSPVQPTDGCVGLSRRCSAAEKALQCTWVHQRSLLGASTDSRLVNSAPDNSPNHDAATLPATRMRYTASQHKQPMMQLHLLLLLIRLHYTGLVDGTVHQC